jgi:hypothetical protein
VFPAAAARLDAAIESTNQSRGDGGRCFFASGTPARISH